MKKIYNFTTEKLEITKLLNRLSKVQKIKSIVFTNGCFDLLHSGHVALLNDSKKLGDILIVGMNSDKSVKLLKGQDRPIIDEENRAYMLSSLSSVDYVIMFDEYNVADLIEFISPDIITKGGEYTVDDLDNVGGSFMKKKGGKVMLVPHREGTSTSELISKIIKTYKK